MQHWLLGLDDTDVIGSPGTNKLALHLAKELSPSVAVRMIVRHQLFFDPRVPYTSHNGSASFLVEVPDSMGVGSLANLLRPMVVDWSPVGSDPGFCIAPHVSPEIVDFASRCQHEVVCQEEALLIAERNRVHLEAVGGTGDGVIGALAAVGLLSTRNDGRVLHAGDISDEPYSITGCHEVASILGRGVARVQTVESGERVRAGAVRLRKKLRPNLRSGEVVLFVQPAEESGAGVEWEAVKLV